MGGPRVIELRHLRYLVAVVDAGGFGRAASRVRVAQPALSRQIAQLETIVGAPLLERGAGGVRPTAAGRQLADDARRILAEVAASAERARRAARGEAGTLAVGFVDGTARRGVVAAALRAMRERHPGVGLHATVMASVQQQAALREGTLDAGFLHYRDPAESGLDGLVVARERVLLAVPAGSPWATGPTPRLADLRGEPFVWFPPAVAPGYDAALRAACLAAGLVPQVQHYAVNSGSILGLVAAGLGVAFQSALGTGGDWSGQVAFREPPDLDLEVVLELAWRRDRRTPVLDRFVEIAREAAAN
jgi:DNA-binding transcriptional LysR family regulator